VSGTGPDQFLPASGMRILLTPGTRALCGDEPL